MPKILKRRVVERLDPEEEDFSDVDGDLRNQFALVNEDPTRHYIWAHDNSDDVGLFKSHVVPYRLERHAKDDSVRVLAAGNDDAQEGAVISKRGHVLMSCDKALWEKRQRLERLKSQKVARAFIRDRQKTVVAGQHRGEWDALR